MAVVSDVLTALRWEWFRLSRRAAFRVIAALMAAGVVVTLIGVAMVAAWGSIPFNAYDYPASVVTLLGAVGPFLAVVFGSLIFGSDFGWGTWRPMTARGMARWRIGLAKLLLAGLALAVFWAFAWVLAALVGLAAGESLDYVMDSETGGWGKTAVGLGASWLVVVAYLGLGAALTTAGRSTAFGLGVGVAIILFELAAYPLAGLMSEELLNIPLNDFTRWSLRGVTSRLDGGDADFSSWVFLPPVLGYAALCWGATLFGLTHRDLNSGNG